MYAISISNNNTLWEKQLSKEEYEQVKNYCKGRKVVEIIPATLKPVRTNNCTNFAKDFFLPTTVNQAIKVKCIVFKIFSILASLVLDLLTFPIRLLTCIPQAISNAKQSETPLHKYLKGERVDKKLLASDHVKVTLEWESPSLFLRSVWNEDGTIRHEPAIDRCFQEKFINFIEQPVYKNCHQVSNNALANL